VQLRVRIRGITSVNEMSKHFFMFYVREICNLTFSLIFILTFIDISITYVKQIYD